MFDQHRGLIGDIVSDRAVGPRRHDPADVQQPAGGLAEHGVGVVGRRRRDGRRRDLTVHGRLYDARSLLNRQ